MKLLIGTKNPSKIRGAKEAFELYYDDVEIEGIDVPSLVSPEPVDEEILKGAQNRVANLKKYAQEHGLSVDFYLAVESGITDRLGKWMITDIAIIEDSEGYESWGTSGSFPVPDKYVDEIKEKELAYVMDELFEQKDLRSNKGGISLLTKQAITRIDLNREAFIMALTEFVTDKWNDRD